jgi:hypothetical protein
MSFTLSVVGNKSKALFALSVGGNKSMDFSVIFEKLSFRETCLPILYAINLDRTYYTHSTILPALMKHPS